MARGDGRLVDTNEGGYSAAWGHTARWFEADRGRARRPQLVPDDDVLFAFRVADRLTSGAATNAWMEGRELLDDSLFAARAIGRESRDAAARASQRVGAAVASWSAASGGVTFREHAAAATFVTADRETLVTADALGCVFARDFGPERVDGGGERSFGRDRASRRGGGWR